MKKNVRKAGIILFWLLAWQILAILCDNQILVAGPIEVLESLRGQIFTITFWQSISGSFVKIAVGFGGAFLLALLTAVIAFRWKLFEDFLAPLLQVMKSVPVASLVVLLLIWTGSEMLAFWVVFLLVFPLIYFGTLEGLKNTDIKMKQLADVYGMSLYNRLIYLYRPVVFPFLISSCKSALGMSWKAGIAAEVIGVPELSIGEKIYMSKIYLDTANLFAWTLVIILISYLFEHAVLFLIKKVAYKAYEPGENKNLQKETETLALKDIQIGYEKDNVLVTVSGQLKAGERYGVMGASGIGKTTFFHTLISIIKPVRGEILGEGRISVVFQEDRLFEKEDAVTNVWMMCKKNHTRKEVEKALAFLIGEEHIHKPAGMLSGGMKRRVCVCRAMMAESNVILMDEPFTGMDEEVKNKTISYIKEHLDARIFLFSTHHEEDLARLEATKCEIIGINEKTLVF